MRGRGMSFIYETSPRNSRLTRWHVGQLISIDVLPDDVLLVIFDFCVARVRDRATIRAIESWQSLVHVCGRWRTLVFRSPRRLNLRLVCTPRRPARHNLDIWPALHLQIQGTISSTSTDDIVVALGHGDRVYRVDLEVIGGLQWDKVLASMQVPLPELTYLDLHSNDETLPVIPNTFLSGSTPRLRYLKLKCIPFPGIPKLLLSATHLVQLYLCIPHSGYFSPDAMASSLSVLTRLGSLSLEFLSSRSRPDRESRHPPPLTRSLLPNLTAFWFKGVSGYLDDLVAWFDAPRLDNLFINFFHQINFNTPHLVQFISRIPVFGEPDEAEVDFELDVPKVRLRSCTDDDYGELSVKISCGQSDQQLSSIAQVCTRCLPSLPKVESLQVFTNDPNAELDWKDNIENNHWLELLRPFTAVKSIYLSEEFQLGIASALQELVGRRTTEVLPSLQNIFLMRFEQSGPFQEAIKQFIAARQLSGHPIAVFPS